MNNQQKLLLTAIILEKQASSNDQMEKEAMLQTILGLGKGAVGLGKGAIKAAPGVGKSIARGAGNFTRGAIPATQQVLGHVDDASSLAFRSGRLARIYSQKAYNASRGALLSAREFGGRMVRPRYAQPATGVVYRRPPLPASHPSLAAATPAVNVPAVFSAEEQAARALFAKNHAATAAAAPTRTVGTTTPGIIGPAINRPITPPPSNVAPLTSQAQSAAAQATATHASGPMVNYGGINIPQITRPIGTTPVPSPVVPNPKAVSSAAPAAAQATAPAAQAAASVAPAAAPGMGTRSRVWQATKDALRTPFRFMGGTAAATTPGIIGSH